MGKKAGLADVAAAAGVSPATVDRVLNGRGGVSPDKESRVLEWARKLQLDRNLERRPTRIVRIGVVMQNPANPFYEALQQTFVKANTLYAGASFQIVLHYFDVTAPKETAALLAKVAQKHDALIVIVPDHPLITEALRKIAVRLPLVTMVSDLPLPEKLAYVGLDNRAAGRTAGELMGRYVGAAGGDIMVVSGMQSFIGQGEREMGFRSVLAERYPQCRLLAVVETWERPERAGELVGNILREKSRVAGIYNLSTGDRSIAEALRAYRCEEHTVFITHELTPERKSLLQEGVIDVVLDQNPELEAMAAVKLLARHFGRHDEQDIRTHTPIGIYLRENC